MEEEAETSLSPAEEDEQRNHATNEKLAFLQNTIDSTTSVKVAHEMEAVLDGLTMAVNAGKQEPDRLDKLYPHAKTIPAGSTTRNLPLPPIDKVFICMRMAREIPQVAMLWLGDYIRPTQFNDYFIKIASPGPATEADLIIVHCGLYWLFCECSKAVTDEETKQDYDAQAFICEANLETVLANLHFHQQVSMDFAYAMGMASLYCLQKSRPSAAWSFINSASQIIQALGLQHAMTEGAGMLEETAQKRSLFWTIYTVEKMLALRLGRSSTIRDQDITLPRLGADRPSGTFLAELAPGWINIANIQGRIYDDIYSTGALMQPPHIRMSRAQALATELKIVMQHAQDIHFTYGPAYTSGQLRPTNPLFVSSGCVASSLDIPDESPPPWTINVTASDIMTVTSASTVAVIFDPESDILIADAKFITFEISSGITCAPDCQDPWQTGDPWPLPEESIYTKNTTGDLKGVAPRILAKPNAFASEQYLLPIEKEFSRYEKKSFQFVQGRASAIDVSAKTVTVDNASTISFDYLVLASGSTTASTNRDSIAIPFKQSNSDNMKSLIRNAQDSISKAQNIIIGGAGPIGVELAGEVAEAAQQGGRRVDVTLVSATSRILPMLKPAGSTAAEKMLVDAGVKILKSQKVVGAIQHQGSRLWTVTLEEGRTLDADLYIPTTGVLPNNKFIPVDFLDKDGWVIVDKELRVKGRQESSAAALPIFAAGDITNNSMRLSFKALEQAAVVAGNLKAEILGQGKPKLYDQGDKTMMVVPIGSTGGTGLIMGWTPWSILVRIVKGKDFLISKAHGAVSS
ncbi:uncharacterized protein DNG_07367 [Cephalotrichum gorgonifer]|uniref:Xylanolytic transcriptional activator regulatory domain-containing protein n=1 Tax=Cephalotrichum gorgonifer TaxID=2041049 RepID=A0AAE8SY52_9PEZI|nr:uncharacterized protein DNG_07367 [Cephalotrichum gorgonifer]